jgi:Xaa-Pro aminopeptidase
MVKDPEEIRAIGASARLISEVVEEVVRETRPGMAESEVAWRIQGLAREAGADGLAFPSIVASGPNGALPHAVPGDRRLEQGEPIILDVGVRLGGYCSDMTRTVFLGEPSSEWKRIYMTVREAQLQAMGEVRPGVKSDHPHGVARQVIDRAGYGNHFGHALGHGVGLATHEAPRLSPVKPTELREGMVVTVEPGIYLPGKGGVRLEEMVILEPQGVRVLTTNRQFYDFSGDRW